MFDWIVGIFAAGGLLAALWAFFGWLVLPMRAEAMLVFSLRGDEPHLERQIRAFLFLKESGLADGVLCLLDCGASPQTLAVANRFSESRTDVLLCSEREFYTENG